MQNLTPNGFLKEEAKGNIKYLNKGESVDFIYNAGMMTGSELQDLIQKLFGTYHQIGHSINFKPIFSIIENHNSM